MKRFTLAIAILLAGCAPKLSFSNEAGGVVNQQFSMGNDRAYQIAQKSCEKYGKNARITSDGVISNKTRFECVTGK